MGGAHWNEEDGPHSDQFTRQNNRGEDYMDGDRTSDVLAGDYPFVLDLDDWPKAITAESIWKSLRTPDTLYTITSRGFTTDEDKLVLDHLGVCRYSWDSARRSGYWGQLWQLADRPDAWLASGTIASLRRLGLAGKIVAKTPRGQKTASPLTDAGRAAGATAEHQMRCRQRPAGRNRIAGAVIRNAAAGPAPDPGAALRHGDEVGVGEDVEG